MGEKDTFEACYRFDMKSKVGREHVLYKRTNDGKMRENIHYVVEEEDEA